MVDFAGSSEEVGVRRSEEDHVDAVVKDEDEWRYDEDEGEDREREEGEEDVGTKLDSLDGGGCNGLPKGRGRPGET